ncbi:MAG: tyrosine--tRNA ligase, partial [Ruminiclostridium sp.]|nr:tyrosine--tRNA ligase [Ruminiclostridium sp.]
NKALAAAKSLFGGSGVSENMHTDEIPADLFADNKIGILDLLVAAKLAPSKREARQLISGGGILVNDVKIADPNEQIDFAEGSVIVKKGKKVIHKVVKA